MPELPEVETVVRFIIPFVTGKTIKRIIPRNDYKKVFAIDSAYAFNRKVCNQIVKRVYRRGKYIVFQLTRGVVLIHLRMTGRLLTGLSANDSPKHLTAQIDFSDGTKLYFKDYRKFGRFYFYTDMEFFNQTLGLEPLSTEFTATWLFTALQQKSRMVKPLLLDQKFIAGLGNIYVDEALWAAKVHPMTVSHMVSRQKTRLLQVAIQNILRASIELQGTTIINFYFGEGSQGNFRSNLKVFDRAGEECLRCNSVITKIRVGQRGTHICPRCQRLKKQ